MSSNNRGFCPLSFGNHPHSELGRGELLALISTAAFIYAFRVLDNQGLVLQYISNPIVYTCVLVILGVISIFSIGYTLHFRLIGGVSSRKLTGELKEKIKELESLIKSSQTQIVDIEFQLSKTRGIATRKTIDCLALSRRIVAALEKRFAEAKEMTKFGGEVNLIQAYDLLTQVLQITDNCLESLIDTEPVPPLKPYEWEPTLQRLFEQIYSELNGPKVAQSRQ